MLKSAADRVLNDTKYNVHEVLHTLKILISQKPYKVEALNFRQ